MPTLHWIGKDKVINHHQDVPFRLLDHQYGALPNGTQTAEPTGSCNQIIHGDNLEALKAPLPQYEGRVVNGAYKLDDFLNTLRKI